MHRLVTSNISDFQCIIRQVLSPLSLHDRNNEMVEEFIYKSTMHKTLTADEDEL